jgi:predicted phosphodiesterase
MRVAALCDIHANMPALEAVLAEVEREGVDALVLGGDVAAGPLPLETVEALMALGPRARFVRGNADREIVEAFDEGRTESEIEQDPAQRAAAFAAGRLSRPHRDFLAGFADTIELELDGLGATLFCHGSPRSDTEILTAVTPPERLKEVLREVKQPVVVGGHTHQQFDRRVGHTRMVNAGSVGVPYEGRAGAYWALLGPGVELRRTDYDLERALPVLRAGGFQDLDEMLRESLIEPADPNWVAEFFERQASGGG